MSGLERTPRTRIWAFGGGLFLLLSLAHGLYLQQPGLAGGPLLFLDNLFTLLFSFSFLALATALGLGVLSRTRLDGLSDTDTLAFSLALGSGVLATGILILGSVGGFHLPWLFLLLLAGVWVGRANLGRLPDLGLGAAKETAEVAGRPALLVFAAVAVAMILLAVAPPTDYDSLMYHLEGPAQFLERGGIYLPDGNFHVAYVGLAHMLYIPALAFGAPSTPAVLSTLFALALGFLVLRVTSNVFTVAEARLGLVLLWGSPILMLVAATPKVDVTLAFFLLAGHYALLNALYQPPRVGKWMALSGLVLGLAVGVKYLALVYVAALSPLVFLILFQAAGPGRHPLRTASLFAAAFLGAAFPWLLKNWVLFGAPLYPYLSEPAIPRWLASLADEAHVRSVLGPATPKPLLAAREPFSPVTWLLHPERLTPESEGGAYGANLAFLFLLAALPLIRRRAFAAITLPAALFFGGTLLMNGGTPEPEVPHSGDPPADDRRSVRHHDSHEAPEEPDTSALLRYAHCRSDLVSVGLRACGKAPGDPGTPLRCGTLVAGGLPSAQPGSGDLCLRQNDWESQQPDPARRKASHAPGRPGVRFRHSGYPGQRAHELAVPEPVVLTWTMPAPDGDHARLGGDGDPGVFHPQGTGPRQDCLGNIRRLCGALPRADGGHAELCALPCRVPKRGSRHDLRGLSYSGVDPSLGTTDRTGFISLRPAARAASSISTDTQTKR